MVKGYISLLGRCRLESFYTEIVHNCSYRQP